MNLLEAEWIPVRHASSRKRWIAPHQVTENIDDDPIVSLDASRADFNGALAQFLIGLVQTAWTVAGKPWDRDLALWEPPAPDELRKLFSPLREAFKFDGDGARFMQDLTLGPDDKPSENSVAALLIEAPGEQSLKRNTDHFIKRAGVKGVCLDCAATALFTLMINAPKGGSGNRTSLRGGGPLTTLIVYDPEGEGHSQPALWRDVVCNVLEPALLLSEGDRSKTQHYFIFPWLAAQDVLQKPGSRSEVQPLDVHPAHVFWAMPRRIRLDFAATGKGNCDICGRSQGCLITRYCAKNYGLNYKGPWRHPLSPYYRTKPAEPARPMHPQAGGLGYRHWLGWVLGTSEGGRQTEPAKVVRAFLESVGGSPFRLWAFGFDMDDMKARGWQEATFPLFDLPAEAGDITEALRGIIDALLRAATCVAIALRMNVRDAWLGNGEARGDLSFVEISFWHATEASFFDAVREAVELVRQHGRDAREASTPLRESWIRRLRREALSLFDQYAASGDVEACHPERLAAAHRSLCNQLSGNALLQAVGLKSPDHKPQRGRRKTAAASA